MRTHARTGGGRTDYSGGLVFVPQTRCTMTIPNPNHSIRIGRIGSLRMSKESQ